ncbi:hypothetical protein H9P43_003559 [Blastocladiella emersonii ATCC 22665]|nr:hypothetical protein H9P43_003559 [Blastocladiella emersonii ATCC 22665]
MSDRRRNPQPTIDDTASGAGEADAAPARDRDRPKVSRQASILKFKGVFQSELTEMLYTHGDPADAEPDPNTMDLLEDMMLEFVYDTCVQANRMSSSKSRLKIDDLRLVFRNDPVLLGRIEEIIRKEKKIALARRAISDQPDLTDLARFAEEESSPAGGGAGALGIPGLDLGGGAGVPGGDSDDDGGLAALLASATGKGTAAAKDDDDDEDDDPLLGGGGASNAKGGKRRRRTSSNADTDPLAFIHG